MFLLLIGGLETTLHLLSHAAHRLYLQPGGDDAAARAAPPIPRFIEEVLRHEPPVHGIIRMTTQEVELGGTRLPKGARVLTLMGSANRDESHFPEPGLFNLDRPGPQNLPFGHGIHFCLGSQLARLEARLAVEALLARFSRLTQGDAPVQWNSVADRPGPREASRWWPTRPEPGVCPAALPSSEPLPQPRDACPVSWACPCSTEGRRPPC